MIVPYWESRDHPSFKLALEERSRRYVEDFAQSPMLGVEVVRVKQPFGGHRLWVVCPDCRKRRIALVEMEKNRFSCRVCGNVPHLSTRLSPLARQHYKAYKILFCRLGGIDAKRVCRKPRYMRWPTYARLYREMAVLNEFSGVYEVWCAKPDPRLARYLRNVR
jgi:ribosomal protein S27E